MNSACAFLRNVAAASSLIVLLCLAASARAAAEGDSAPPSNLNHQLIAKQLSKPPVVLIENQGQRADLSSQVAKAGADYHGDGLVVTRTDTGARLRCLFQRLEGEATPEGLWLTSTVTNQSPDKFRVVARAVGRVAPCAPGATDKTLNHPQPTSIIRLETTGSVSVDGKLVRFARPGLVEEYSASLDGVRQDFVVLQKPPLTPSLSPSDGERVADRPGEGELRLELAVTGARVEQTASGAQLVLEKSGRKIAYSTLRVTDATGKELPARMEVMGSARVPRAGSGVAPEPLSEADRAERSFRRDAENHTPEARAPHLAVVVNDTDAVYPIRIDPTFSDANWISMNPSIPGADRDVRAVVVDGSGNLYIGGAFTVVGDVVAIRVAKWNGSSWSALGSGMSGASYPYVSALAVSGSDLYAGGNFTTAGRGVGHQHHQMERQQLERAGLRDGWS